MGVFAYFIAHFCSRFEPNGQPFDTDKLRISSGSRCFSNLSLLSPVPSHVRLNNNCIYWRLYIIQGYHTRMRCLRPLNSFRVHYCADRLRTLGVRSALRLSIWLCIVLRHYYCNRYGTRNVVIKGPLQSLHACCNTVAVVIIMRIRTPWSAAVFVRRLKASCEYETNEGWAAGRKKKIPSKKELNLIFIVVHRHACASVIIIINWNRIAWKYSERAISRMPPERSKVQITTLPLYIYKDK